MILGSLSVGAFAVAFGYSTPYMQRRTGSQIGGIAAATALVYVCAVVGVCACVCARSCMCASAEC